MGFVDVDLVNRQNLPSDKIQIGTGLDVIALGGNCHLKGRTDRAIVATEPYSERKICAGSILLALIAGIRLAKTAPAMNSKAAIA